MDEYIQKKWQQLIQTGKEKIVSKYAKFKNTGFVHMTSLHKVKLSKLFQFRFESFELL